jgi:quinol monooxygenase YgiN
VALFIFARFHAREGRADAVAAALRETVAATRDEPGCLEIEAFRSTRDPALFYIHSHFVDEAAFEAHAALPRVSAFVDHMETLIDHPFEATRTARLEA